MRVSLLHFFQTGFFFENVSTDLDLEQMTAETLSKDEIISLCSFAAFAQPCLISNDELRGNKLSPPAQTVWDLMPGVPCM